MSGMEINPAFLQNTWLLFLHFSFLIRYLKRLSVDNISSVFGLKLKNFYKTVFPFKLVIL